MRNKPVEANCRTAAFLLVMALVSHLLFSNVAFPQTLSPLLPEDLIFTNQVNEIPVGPAITFDGSRYLVVWSEYSRPNGAGIDSRIYGCFVNKYGGAEGPPFLIESYQSQEFYGNLLADVSVAFNGSSFLVAWHDIRDGITSIRGRLVDRSGKLGSTIVVTDSDLWPGSSPMGNFFGVASDGNDFLVVWTGSYWGVCGQRVSGAGERLGDSFPIGLGINPSVCFGGGKYLVAWQSGSTHDFLRLHGAFVSPEGDVFLEFPISADMGIDWEGDGQGISFDGHNFLVVWSEKRNGAREIYGNRITPEGQLLDGPADGGGFRISETGFGPRAAFDGTNWIVVWSSWSINRGDAGIWGTTLGARVTPNGELLDSNGSVLPKNSGMSAHQYYTALASDGLNCLVMWVSEVNPEIGPYHLDAQLVGTAVSSNHPPVANAGQDQTVHVGSSVTLDGSASSDPDGDALIYIWQIISWPGKEGGFSAPDLSVDPNSPSKASFTVARMGDYVAWLVVTDCNGAASLPATVTISTSNSKPVASTGPDQAIILVGSTVQLNGSTSYDDDGDTLAYQWSFIDTPTGSNAALANAATSTPNFVADVHGTYTISLIVSDPWVASEISQVVVSFTNVKPMADAGATTSVLEGETAILDGSGSNDANHDPLTYKWSIASKPEGSDAVLENADAQVATFIPDLPGAYVAQLIVNDGFVDSEAKTVTIQSLENPDWVSLQIKNELQPAIATLGNVGLTSVTGAGMTTALQTKSAFKNPNMKNTLLNKTNAVLAELQTGNIRGAVEKLKNDILSKTDGCATTGAPDKDDWIIDSASQAKIYPIVMEIIAELGG
jgi:hypothetical protein